MVTPPEPDGDVRVLDFGLARAHGSIHDRATASHVLVGTPLYIAPERVADPEHFDVLTDIYSVGILAFAMLVGCEPGRVTKAMRDQAGLSIGAELKAGSFSDIPNELDEWIRSCMAQDPCDRFPTAADALAKLPSK